jgi:archaellum biogenesis ATPase FlaH
MTTQQVPSRMDGGSGPFNNGNAPVRQDVEAELIAAFRHAQRVGIRHLYPVGGDKKPIGKWVHGDVNYTVTPPDEADMRRWVTDHRTQGWAALCGNREDGLLVVDVEPPGMDEALICGALESVPGHCLRRSVHGGMHAYLLCFDGDAVPTEKLARNAGGVLLAEVRGVSEGAGAGAYAVLVGPGRPSLAVDFAPYLVTRAELDTILGMIRQAGTYVAPVKPATTTPNRTGSGRASGTGRVISDAVLAGALTWPALLGSGWTAHATGDGISLRRPVTASEDGSKVSAESGNALGAVLTIHSQSVDWATPGVPVGAPQAFALSHWLTFSDAMRAAESAAATVAAGEGVEDGHPCASWPLDVLAAIHEARVADEGDVFSPAYVAPAVELGDRLPTLVVADTRTPFERDVDRVAYELSVRRQAQRQVDSQEAAASGEAPEPESLTFTLDNPDPGKGARIRDVSDIAGTVAIVAQRKTGKTTLVANLVLSLVSGKDFLGHFPVKQYARRVMVLNYEMTREMFADWLRDHRLGVWGDAVLAWHLRGYANPLRSESGRVRLSSYLDEKGVEVVIVDTFAQAFTGRNPNDNGEVSWFLNELRQVVGPDRDIFITVHAGWGADHARGASALEDWPDTLITLTTDKDDPRDGARYLSIRGRSAYEADGLALSYDAGTRTVTVDPFGAPKHEAIADKREAASEAGRERREARREAERAETLVAELARVVDLLTRIPNLTTRKVRDHCGWSGTTAGRVLFHGVEVGQLVVDESERYPSYSVAAREAPDPSPGQVGQRDRDTE